MNCRRCTYLGAYVLLFFWGMEPAIVYMEHLKRTRKKYYFLRMI